MSLPVLESRKCEFVCTIAAALISECLLDGLIDRRS